MHVQQTPYRLLKVGETLSRSLWCPDAEVPDSVAKAAEYKRLFEESKLSLQTVEDARADPPIGFQPAPPPVAGAVSLHICLAILQKQATISKHLLHSGWKAHHGMLVPAGSDDFA